MYVGRTILLLVLAAKNSMCKTPRVKLTPDFRLRVKGTSIPIVEGVSKLDFFTGDLGVPGALTGS